MKSKKTNKTVLQHFKNMKLKWKLAISTLILLPSFIATIFLVINKLNDIEMNSAVIKQNSINQEKIIDIKSVIYVQRSKIENYEQNDYEDLAKEIQETNKILQQKLNAIQLHQPSNQNRIELLKTNIQYMDKELPSFIHKINFKKEYLNNYEKIEKQIHNISSYLNTNNVEMQKKIEGNIDEIKQNLILTTLIILTLFLFVNYVTVTTITDTFQKIVDIAKRVSEGDLTVEKIKVTSDDEIGTLAKAVNKMVENLKHIIQKTNATIEEVAASAEELSVSTSETSKTTEHITLSVKEIAEGSEKQQEKTKDTVHNVNQISKELSEIYRNIEKVNKSGFETKESLSEGNQLLMESIKKMEEIYKKSYDLFNIVSSLGKHSKEIMKIVHIITELSKKTDTLSLNANIEAAKAGEAGESFSVIAEEVKELAEKSSNRAEEINKIIFEMKQKIDTVIVEVDNSKKSVEEGMQLARSTGKTFEDITETINSISKEIESVTEASKGIQNGASVMVKAIDTVKQISIENSAHTQTVASSTQEQNASMEEIAASAERLAQLGEELRREIDIFKL